MIRYCFMTFCAFFFCISQVYAKASKSIDPEGKYFLQRGMGDTYNCGPLTALIARQYADKEFKAKNLRTEISSARSLVDGFERKSIQAQETTWWKLKDIQVYLRFMGVSARRHQLKEENIIGQLQDSIEHQKLVIINVNMNDFPYGKETGKPYKTFYVPGGWGHYLAIVGVTLHGVMQRGSAD